MKTASAKSMVAQLLAQSGYVFAFVLFVLLFTIVQSPAMQNEPAVLPPPVVSSEYFPCTACHQHDEVAKEQRSQKAHLPIQVQGHTEDQYDCFGCHDKKDMDKLILFNGSTIDLISSSQLCGQCHSTSFKLWQSGLHGKVVGNWNGPQKVTPCTRCHDPHRPAFRAQKPEPPPTAPDETLRWNK